MLKPLERRQQIVRDIDTLDDKVILTLSRKYGVSEMTIRRDLKALEASGLVKRTYGGAVRWPQMAAPPLLDRDKRQAMASTQKARIARLAAQELVTDGDIIIVEGGTTATAMAPYLADKRDLTVVTNGLATAEEMRRHLSLDATIMCAGGILRPESSTFVGPLTEGFFREMHAHTLFLSATGLTLREGVTDPKMLETQVKRAMVASAGRVTLLMDSGKFGVRSLTRVLDFREVALLVTDEDAPPEIVAGLRERGVEVLVATAT